MIKGAKEPIQKRPGAGEMAGYKKASLNPGRETGRPNNPAIHPDYTGSNKRPTVDDGYHSRFTLSGGKSKGNVCGFNLTDRSGIIGP
jgi:hypothetical protein